MNSPHKILLNNIKGNSPKNFDSTINEKYHGNKHISYGLSVPAKRNIAKEFKKAHLSLSFNEYIELLNCLNAGKSYEEKTIAGEIMHLYKDYKIRLTPKYFNKWLDNLEGWGEIDSLCQSAFSAEEILLNWNDWEKYLNNFNTSKNISKRRASLVLLTKPVNNVKDIRLEKLAFKNIENLKHEKDILITKAISWLLREMIKNYKKEVTHYIAKNKTSLPAIAVRETIKKLETGKK